MYIHRITSLITRTLTIREWHTLHYDMASEPTREAVKLQNFPGGACPRTPEILLYFEQNFVQT